MPNTSFKIVINSITYILFKMKADEEIESIADYWICMDNSFSKIVPLLLYFLIYWLFFIWIIIEISFIFHYFSLILFYVCISIHFIGNLKASNRYWSSYPPIIIVGDKFSYFDKYKEKIVVNGFFYKVCN